MDTDSARKKYVKLFLRSFIPLHISNRFLWNTYKIFAWIRVPDFVREKNRAENRMRLRAAEWEFWGNPAAYIENQHEWKNILFGAGFHHNMSYSGCEIIAVYNAKKALGVCGTPERMADLIYGFEAGGAALMGEFGTSPAAIVEYFKKSGFSVLVTLKEEKAVLDKISRKCPVMIATVYNDKYDILKQVHTVCITGSEGQGYIVHNAYHRDINGTYVASRPYTTLVEAVKNISEYGPKLISLIGIRRKG